MGKKQLSKEDQLLYMQEVGEVILKLTITIRKQRGIHKAYFSDGEMICSGKILKKIKEEICETCAPLILKCKSKN